MGKLINWTVAPSTAAVSRVLAGTASTVEYYYVAERRSHRISGSPPRAIAAAVLVATMGLCATAPPATADLGPCRTVAPTTPNVHVFVSDVDRAARWYRDNAGLSEVRRWAEQTFDGATLVSMQRGLAGVTLVGWPHRFADAFRDPQMVCLVLDGPPAPPAGASALFLADPDGTSVELPPVPTQPSIASEGKAAASEVHQPQGLSRTRKDMSQ